MAAPVGTFHPGAAPFGNFINYYSFNPPEKRIRFLPDDLLRVISNVGRKRNVAVLDVGCNAGNLTEALYLHLTKPNLSQAEETEDSLTHAASTDEANDDISNTAEMSHLSRDSLSVSVNVLGCDIDETLIFRAHESNSFPKNIAYRTVDFMCDASRQSNLTEFLSSRDSETIDRFDLVCCFSITMWIHLQHGDAGLRKFLTEAARLSRYLLVEPQPWKCYKSALRRVRKVGIENSWRFTELTMRENVDENIRDYLTSACQMELVRTLGETHWERKLLLFRNTSDTDS
ncbi:pre-miRNA 5'-monophosphate methyltransferase-like [Patiria miniata]|uniref:RNA methyltransferase n=1 Tax=Patiria miniata TaxID=46514 RepID=A0A913ZAT1_PATMI|nr:pre-miRNA 5'-monophosphate methyltransferase-like [Patiria miniata]